MTDRGVSEKRTPPFTPNAGRTEHAASSQRCVWIAILQPPPQRRLVSVWRKPWSRPGAKGRPLSPVTEQVSAMKVTLNKSRTLCFSDPFSTAVIGAPEIADVLPMTNSMLYVQGKKVGATNISDIHQQRRLVSVVDLDVTPDTTSLQNKIAASTGGRDINVTSVNGEINSERRGKPTAWRPRAPSKSRRASRRTLRSSTR